MIAKLRSMRPIGIIDRYVLQRMATPLLGLCAVTVALLSIENLPRLLHLIGNVDRPMIVMGRMMVGLLPEYFSLGLLIGGFLSTTLMLRTLAINSEMDAFWAAGIAPMRMMRCPMLVGILLACTHLGLRGFVEPWSEQAVDRIAQQTRNGDFGFAIKEREIRHFPPATTFLADHVDPVSGRLGDVFVENAGITATARAARLHNGGDKGLLLVLEDGMIMKPRQVLRFRSFVLPIQRTAPMVPAQSATERADRIALPRLINSLHNRGAPIAGIDPATAAAAIALRLGQAGMAGLVPWLAFVLAIPPRRSTSAIGSALGFCLIVGFIEAGKLLSAMPAPFLTQSALLASLVALILAIMAWQRRDGLDIVERHLSALWQRRPRVSLTRHLRASDKMETAA